MLKNIAKFLLPLIILYLLIVSAAAFFQQKLLFHPSPALGEPSAYGIKGYERVAITTSDNLKLVAWFHKAQAGNKAIVYFYGNADSLGSYEKFFNTLAAHGYSVLGINYRGYGGSEGEPSEEGVYKDARAAIQFLKKYNQENEIAAVGRSLGTGVAVEMAKEFDLNAIVLISPYTSITDVAARVYPYLPVSLISRYHFDSLNKISQISEPVLIIHGDKDNLIPLANGQALYKAANSRKALNIYQGSDHILLDQNRIVSDIIKFIDQPNAAK